MVPHRPEHPHTKVEQEDRLFLAECGGTSEECQEHSLLVCRSMAALLASLDKLKKTTVAVLCLLTIASLLFDPSGRSHRRQNISNGSHDASRLRNGEIHQSMQRMNELPSRVSFSSRYDSEELVSLTKTYPRADTLVAGSAVQQIAVLKSHFAGAKANFLSNLRRDYGEEALQAMFFFDPTAPDGMKNRTNDFKQQKYSRRPSLGRYIYRSGNPNSHLSWNRARRKVVMKLCSVLNLTAQNQAQGTRTVSAKQSSIEWVWATGGPSTAAGHGNFHSESYTAVLERVVGDIFAAVGMKFTARNCGMSAMASAVEVALCAPQIFGTDVDLLVYDYAITDSARHTWMQKLFQYRAGRFFPNRPIQLAVQCMGKAFNARAEIVQQLEELGLSVLIEDESLHRAVMAAVPDSFGKSQAEISDMPPFIRNFRCRDQIESGDPYCSRDKYNQTDCLLRQYQTSWHPGWKHHAVVGTLMALFLVELLEDALTELSSAAVNVNPTELLRSLQAAEDTEYEQFLSAPADVGALQNSIADPAKRDGFDFASLASSPSFCHTARLPSEIRFRGILTESAGISNTSHFERGTFLDEALLTNATGAFLRLVYDNNEDEPKFCPIPTNMDRHDYFFVSGAESWKTLIVPNDAEIQAYGTGKALNGYIAACFAPCKHDKCPVGTLKVEDFLDGKFELSVNGVKAESMTSLQQHCELLKNNYTGYLWQPNSEGRFEFGARISRIASATNFLRLGAIIVW